MRARFRHFLAQCQAEGLAPKVLDNSALEHLRTYPWPGNVRELENQIRRLVALHSEEVITADIVRSDLLMAAAVPSESGGGDHSLGTAVEKHLARYFAAHDDGLPPEGLYGRVLAEVERPVIAMSLKAPHGNQIRAAKLLGLNRNTLRKKIRELGMTVTRGR